VHELLNLLDARLFHKKSLRKASEHFVCVPEHRQNVLLVDLAVHLLDLLLGMSWIECDHVVLDATNTWQMASQRAYGLFSRPEACFKELLELLSVEDVG